MRRITISTTLLCFPLLGVAQNNPPGFDSPGEAFRAYWKGAVSQDFDLMLSSLTAESKAYHIGLTIASATYLFEANEMQQLFREHGIDGSVGDGRKKSDAAQVGERAFIDAMTKVKNPAKFMKAIAGRLEKIAKFLADGDPAQKKPPTHDELLSTVKLGKIAFTGDTAMATVEASELAKDHLSTIPTKVQFRRIDGRWYADVDPR